ncbi:hypothetical protein NDU88_001863 [Pleurodeles waltl]|uniref:Uncharacterized protein n=1 Tax=Pleurodeles waltl TaxID=8319 RepID=A0AAV7WP03_PLEWA|nr:hypothetical protein NDU88_001863 [Pleurodeles waltl]
MASVSSRLQSKPVITCLYLHLLGERGSEPGEPLLGRNGEEEQGVGSAGTTLAAMLTNSNKCMRGFFSAKALISVSSEHENWNERLVGRQDGSPRSPELWVRLRSVIGRTTRSKEDYWFTASSDFIVPFLTR